MVCTFLFYLIYLYWLINITMSDDKIAQALNMRSLQDINDEKQELLDEVNPDKLPDLPVNAFSTNEEVDNLPIEQPVQHPVPFDAGAEENLKDIEKSILRSKKIC